MSDQEEDYAAECAAETETEQWWDALRERSVGTSQIPEWGYIWAGVMLRRAASGLPQSLKRYRTFKGWTKLIQEQHTSLDPIAVEYREQIFAFLVEQGSPWSTLYDERHAKWTIMRVATLDEDIAFARAKQRARMDEEQRLREDADRKQELTSGFTFSN